MAPLRPGPGSANLIIVVCVSIYCYIMSFEEAQIYTVHMVLTLSTDAAMNRMIL